MGFFDGNTEKPGSPGAEPKKPEASGPALSVSISAVSSDEDSRTKRHGGSRDERIREGFDPMERPVVGWLVVIDGRLKGASFQLTYGQNKLGRDDSADVCFDQSALGAGKEKFLDQEISRLHCIVTYDQENRKFFIQQHPESTNLTYLENEEGNPEPILVPAELTDRSKFKVGSTKLMFVALCNGAFDWKELPRG
ncbi:MAG: FHA domain-containing protein [Pseudomonadota bacterium]